jgi:hypothetical protein
MMKPGHQERWEAKDLLQLVKTSQGACYGDGSDILYNSLGKERADRDRSIVPEMKSCGTI